jgi:hypothetical protein
MISDYGPQASILAKPTRFRRRSDIDVALLELRRQGPSPLGYQVKNLGKSKGHLWQMNLKVNRKQIRILYAPDKDKIVVFRIHKKGSPQEQQRAYLLAMARKKEAEEIMKGGGHVGSLAVH